MNRSRGRLKGVVRWSLSVWTLWVGLFVGCLFPGLASAHSPIKGIDSLYSGFLHPLWVPAHLIAVLVLGFWLGQAMRALSFGRVQWAVFGYLIAAVLGLFGAAHGLGAWIGEQALAVLVLVLAISVGLLVAWARVWRLPFYAVLAVALGLSLGLDSAQDGLYGREKLAALFGTGVALYLLLLYAMALSERASRHWQTVGIRVLASWASAAASLVLSLLWIGQSV